MGQGVFIIPPIPQKAGRLLLVFLGNFAKQTFREKRSIPKKKWYC